MRFHEQDTNGYRLLDDDAFDRAVDARMEAVDRLMELAEDVNRLRGSAIDRMHRLRLVEQQAAEVRRALVDEARAVSFTWREIGAALGLSAAAARRRYGTGKRRRR